MRFRVLCSYHFFRTHNIAKLVERLTVNGLPPDIFVDSGAFSAASIGAEVSFDGYCEWIAKWREHFTVYSTLDVIGNAGATQRNTEEMERQGFAPLPVVHFGTDLRRLDVLAERYRYIALGGMVGRGLPSTMKFVAACFARTNPACTVFHGFGMTSTRMLMNFPWYSVDSSSWSSAYRFGSLKLFDQRNGAWATIAIRSPKAWAKHPWVNAQYGMGPRDFVGENWHHTKAAKIAAMQFFASERWLRRRWGIVSLPCGEWPTVLDEVGGLRAYSAIGGAGNDQQDAAREGVRCYAASTALRHPSTAAASAEGLRTYLAVGTGDVYERADRVVDGLSSSPF